jgi:hypothetical protein
MGPVWLARRWRARNEELLMGRIVTQFSSFINHMTLRCVNLI